MVPVFSTKCMECLTAGEELNREKAGDPLLDVSGGSAQSKANNVEA
jgi:hypothetical protein